MPMSEHAAKHMLSFGAGLAAGALAIAVFIDWAHLKHLKSAANTGQPANRFDFRTSAIWRCIKLWSGSRSSQRKGLQRPQLITQGSSTDGTGEEQEGGDEILEEHFTRNIQFFGEKDQQRVASAFVIVVGLGGVGSHAAAMLLRSGVMRLRLIDFDQGPRYPFRH